MLRDRLKAHLRTGKAYVRQMQAIKGRTRIRLIQPRLWRSPQHKQFNQYDHRRNGCRRVIANNVPAALQGIGAFIPVLSTFDTEENLSRSGILHYHLGEGRFVGPRHDRELTSAALDFLSHAGRLPRP